MSKKVNYGTVNNKKSGVKNRFFKYVLCLCLGVVSIFGFMPKNSVSVNAQVFDLDSSSVSCSDSSTLDILLTKDYYGYYDIVGFNFIDSSSCSFYFALYDFDGIVLDYSLVGTVHRLIYGNTMVNLKTASNCVDTYNGVSCFKVVVSNVSGAINRLLKNQDVTVLLFKYINSDALFVSRTFYNMYLNSLSNGGASSEDLELEYNKGYTAGNTEGYNTGYSEGKTAGITEGTTTGYNSGYNEGYTAGYDKCEDDSIPLMQENWQNGYDIGKGEGINEGINQGYNNGYNAGLEDNQPLVYQSGYDEGHLVGKSLGLELGYNNAKEEYYSDQSNFKNLMFSIIDAPFNVLSNAFDFEIFGINMSSFLIAIVSLLLVAFVIRKLM